MSKIKQYLKLKNNPTLGLYQAIQEMKEDLERSKKELVSNVTEEVLKKINSKDPINAGFIEKITSKLVSQTVSELVKDTKGDQGEQGIQGFKGDKGDIGLQGEQGPQGLVGPQGSKGDRGLPGKDGKNGQNGKDGLSGKDGKDGSPDSPVQIRQKLETLVGDERLDASAVKNLQKFVEKGKGGGGLRPGGVNLQWEQPTGATNGSNTTFTLSSVPYDSSMLCFFVNGLLQKVTEDYTISGQTITTLTAPPTGSLISAFYRK